MSQFPHQTVVVQQAPGTSGLAIAGLIFSILGWFTCGLLCIPGAFFCLLALFSRGPKGAAIAGLIVGFPGTLFFAFVGFGLILGILGIGVAATSAIDEAERAVTEAQTEVQQQHVEEEPSEAGQALTEPIFVEIKADVLSSRTIVIQGATNLPCGTQLMYSVTEQGSRGFMGQSKGLVEEGGRFGSEPFGPRNGLNAGRYEVDVTMPIARLQSEEVKRIIGNNGEHLKGPLVEKQSYGVTVRAETTVVVGGADGIEQQIERDKTNLETYQTLYAQAQRLLQDIESMSQKNAGPAEWAGFLRAFNEKAASFGQQLKEVSVTSAGADLRYLNPGHLALRANPHRTTFSPENYRDTLQQYRTDMESAKKSLEREAARIAQAGNGEEEAALTHAEEEVRNATAIDADEWRTWTTANGKYTVEAKFVRFAVGTLTLEKKNGTTVDVKLDLLCPADKDYVRKKRR